MQGFGQVPKAYKYQAIARDNAGNIIANTKVSFRISILQGSISGSESYKETDTATTNQFGLANLSIGMGTIVSGLMDTINWGKSNYYIKVEFDPVGGSNFTTMGTSQMLSVPYALYSQNTNQSWQFPDGLDGFTSIVIAPNSSYTVPANKTIEALTGFLYTIGGDTLVPGDAYIPQGTTIYNTSLNASQALIVTSIVESILWNTKNSLTYTVPAGKNLYLNNTNYGGYVLTNGSAVAYATNPMIVNGGDILTWVPPPTPSFGSNIVFPVLSGYLK